MSKKQTNAPPWQAIEEQAYHAYREWPIWLVLRERELAAHLSLQKRSEKSEQLTKPISKEKSS
ncbi:MAG: hypothetical protein LCI00_15635 [Chloroflexi bacterium]|nr:hypothetical protein [Chloroflexota bacterium]